MTQGTGKTTTLTEVILQIRANIEHSKIVVTTQSNSAADLIVQRLDQSNQFNSENLLRINSQSYENKASTPEDIKQYAKTIDGLDENNVLNFRACLELVKNYKIVVGTSSIIGKLLNASSLRNHFTHAVIDEAGQCTEADVLIPMVLVGKNGQTIMAGDPMQMAPLVLSFHANDRGLGISMLSRLLECYSMFERENAVRLI